MGIMWFKEGEGKKFLWLTLSFLGCRENVFLVCASALLIRSYTENKPKKNQFLISTLLPQGTLFSQNNSVVCVQARGELYIHFFLVNLQRICQRKRKSGNKKRIFQSAAAAASRSTSWCIHRVDWESRLVGTPCPHSFFFPVGVSISSPQSPIWWTRLNFRSPGEGRDCFAVQEERTND